MIDYKTHLAIFRYHETVGYLQALIECDLYKEAKERIPQGCPFFIVEIARRETLPNKDWNNIQVDWNNPDGYGERVEEEALLGSANN